MNLSPKQFISRLLSKCKFRTHNLQTSRNPEEVFRKARVKRFFIKELLDESDMDYLFHLINRKSFKTLQSISLSSITHNHLCSSLKNCKSVREIYITLFNNKLEISKLTTILKKLSRKLLVIDSEEIIPNQNTRPYFFCKFAKVIHRFPKLEYFKRDFGAFGNMDEDYLARELEIYNRLGLRLNKGSEVYFGFSLFEQYEFQEVMKKGRVYPGIYGLIMRLELDYLFNQIGNEAFGSQHHNTMLYAEIPYHLEDREHISQILLKDSNTSEERLNQELTMKHSMIEEMKLFFRFELFPNLKKLEINQDHSDWNTISFVGIGFSALKNLQELEMSFISRSDINTMYVFKQLYHLPLLRNFSLNIPYLKSEEWNFLEQFLKSQEDLETLSLCVSDKSSLKNHYFDQNVSLENTIKSLAEKPFLESLKLKSPYWSLEALSRGFSALKMANQLHTLILEGSDDFITYNEKRVEGLCYFLSEQKATLKILRISLPFVLNCQIVNHLALAISNLGQLQQLQLSINCESQTLAQYFMEALKEDKEKKLTTPGRWVPNIARSLQSLGNLENLTIQLKMLGQGQNESVEWLIDILNILPELKKLRKINILSKRTKYISFVERRITEVLLQLKNIRETEFEFFD